MKLNLRFLLKFFYRSGCRVLKLLNLSEEVNEGLDPQRRRHKELVAFMESLLGDRDVKSLNILDVGCGQGWLIERLHQHGYHNVYGCDFLEKNDAELEYPYRQININTDGLSCFDNNSFDVVVSSDVLEHLENPTEALREMSRVVKPEGCLFITIPNSHNIFQRISFLITGNIPRYRYQPPDEHGHISMFTPNILQSITERANFKIEDVQGGYSLLGGYYLKLPSSPFFSFVVMYHLVKTSL